MVVTSYVFNTQEGQDLYDLIHRSLRMKKAFNKEYLEKIVSYHGIYCMCVYAWVHACVGVIHHAVVIVFDNTCWLFLCCRLLMCPQN